MVSGWKQAQLAYFPEDVEHGLCAPVLCRWNIYRFSTSAAKLAGHLESNLCKKAPVHGADRYQGWLTRDSLPTPLHGCHYGVYQTPDQSQLSRGQLLYGVRRREQYQKTMRQAGKKQNTSAASFPGLRRAKRRLGTKKDNRETKWLSRFIWTVQMFPASMHRNAYTKASMLIRESISFPGPKERPQLTSPLLNLVICF